MAKRKVSGASQEDGLLVRPAITEEAQENRMIALAAKLAEQQLRDGTASSQVITHFLKLGSTKEKLEKQILEKQAELMAAKTENLKSNGEMKELYAKALSAFRSYQGGGPQEEDEDPDFY